MTKRLISAVLALAMLLSMTACAQDSTSEPTKNSSSVSDSSQVNTESENSSESDADSSSASGSDSSSENSTDDSSTVNSETTSATTTTTKNSTTTTTTKSASNDNDSKQKQPQEQQKPQSTQAQPRTTQATAKATVKPVQTTKATTKATQKQNSTIDISKLSKLQQAMYRLSKSNRNYNKQDLEIMRNELLAYGKSLYPSVPICTKLHPLITKDGRYTDSFDEAVGGTNSSTEWYMPSIFDSMNGTDAEIVESDMVWEEVFKRQIKATLDNNARFGDIPTVWYITYGRENDGSLHWVCMTAFPEEWK